MQVIIMRGIGGAGKSTWANDFSHKAFLRNESCWILSADNYFIKDGKYTFDPRKLPDAHALCLKEFMDYTNPDGVLVDVVDYLIVDNTNISLWEMSPYIAIANVHKHPVRIVRVECPQEIAAERNVHGVPQKAIQSMASRMEKALPFWPKEEYVQTS
jgi:predicted kinase